MSEYTKTALVLGAGGFIGSHMVKRLREEDTGFVESILSNQNFPPLEQMSLFLVI